MRPYQPDPDIEPEDSSTDTGPVEQPFSVRYRWAIVGTAAVMFGLMLLLVGIAVSGSNRQNERPGTSVTGNTKPDRQPGTSSNGNIAATFDAIDLAEQWKANQAKFETLSGKTVQVNGKVSTVEQKHWKDGPGYVLKFQNERGGRIFDIDCFFDDKSDVAALGQGQSVSVTGVFTNLRGYFTLKRSKVK